MNEPDYLKFEFLKLTFLFKDVTILSGEGIFKVMEKGVGKIVREFSDSSKPNQNSFLFMKNVIINLLVPDEEICFKV